MARLSGKCARGSFFLPFFYFGWIGNAYVLFPFCFFFFLQNIFCVRERYIQYEVGAVGSSFFLLIFWWKWKHYYSGLRTVFLFYFYFSCVCVSCLPVKGSGTRGLLLPPPPPHWSSDRYSGMTAVGFKVGTAREVFYFRWFCVSLLVWCCWVVWKEKVVLLPSVRHEFLLSSTEVPGKCGCPLFRGPKTSHDPARGPSRM